MRWPVEVPDMDRSELIAEALEDLAHELPGFGLVPLSAPVFSWLTTGTAGRHPGPWLLARFAVRVLA